MSSELPGEASCCWSEWPRSEGSWGVGATGSPFRLEHPPTPPPAPGLRCGLFLSHRPPCPALGFLWDAVQDAQPAPLPCPAHFHREQFPGCGIVWWLETQALEPDRLGLRATPSLPAAWLPTSPSPCASASAPVRGGWGITRVHT